MILLAGVLIVLAYLVYSTQTATLQSIGQEAGREAAAPIRSDFLSLRTAIAATLQSDLQEASGVSRCPTDPVDYKGRIEALLSLLQKQEANRGQNLVAHYLSVNSPFPPPNEDADPARELKTRLDLFLTNGRTSVFDQVVVTTECTP